MATAAKPTQANRAAAMKKFAEVDNRDAAYAFELGFAKAAQDLGMSKSEFDDFYKIAMADHQEAMAKGGARKG